MLLMMFYTTVAGWMLAYIPKMATGTFDGASTEVAGSVFNALLANPSELIGWMIAAIAIGFAVCSLGLQKGVERITKWLMAIPICSNDHLMHPHHHPTRWRRGYRVLPYP